MLALVYQIQMHAQALEVRSSHEKSQTKAENLEANGALPGTVDPLEMLAEPPLVNSKHAYDTPPAECGRHVRLVNNILSRVCMLLAFVR